MPSARKTGTNESIHSYGGVTRDYTSLQTWEDAHTVDCVATTTSHILECYDDSASFDDYATVMGATTNSSYFRIIRPATGQGHDGTPNNGVTFNRTSAGNTFFIWENYFQLQDLIVQLTITDNDNPRLAAFAAFSTGAAIVGCIGKATNAGSQIARGLGIASNCNNSILVDCLAYECKTSGIYVAAGDGNTNYGYNCNGIGCANGIEFGAITPNTTGTVHLRNCLASDNTTDIYKEGTLATSDVQYCASKDATADDWGGTGNRVSQTFSFMNAAGDDWRLKGEDTGAKWYGTNLSSDSFYPFNDDISKRLWGNTWDIGFWRVINKNAILNQYRQRRN